MPTKICEVLVQWQKTQDRCLGTCHQVLILPQTCSRNFGGKKHVSGPDFPHLLREGADVEHMKASSSSHVADIYIMDISALWSAKGGATAAATQNQLLPLCQMQAHCWA